MISGFFTKYDGHPTSCVARLRADGSIDRSFQSSAAKGSVAYTVAATLDGKVIAAGAFKTADDAKRCLARLNPTGSLDESFAANDSFATNVYGVTIDSLGRILVAGGFSKYWDKPMPGFGRLKPDGTMDSDFVFGPTISPSFIQEYPIDREGRVIIYGWRKFGRNQGPVGLCRVLGNPK